MRVSRGGAHRRYGHRDGYIVSMTILYLASFIGGLLLAVAVMIFGVERPRERHPTGERSFRLSPAPIGAFAVVFGVVGYIL